MATKTNPKYENPSEFQTSKTKIAYEFCFNYMPTSMLTVFHHLGQILPLIRSSNLTQEFYTRTEMLTVSLQWEAIYIKPYTYYSLF